MNGTTYVEGGNVTIEKVTRYKTGDDKLHTTLGRARSHVIDNVCKVFDKRLRPALGKVDGLMTANEKFLVITRIVGDYEELTSLMNDLIEAYDEMEEENG